MVSLGQVSSCCSPSARRMMQVQQTFQGLLEKSFIPAGTSPRAPSVSPASVLELPSLSGPSKSGGPRFIRPAFDGAFRANARPCSNGSLTKVAKSPKSGRPWPPPPKGDPMRSPKFQLSRVSTAGGRVNEAQRECSGNGRDWYKTHRGRVVHEPDAAQQLWWCSAKARSHWQSCG